MLKERWLLIWNYEGSILCHPRFNDRFVYALFILPAVLNEAVVQFSVLYYNFVVSVRIWAGQTNITKALVRPRLHGWKTTLNDCPEKSLVYVH